MGILQKLIKGVTSDKKAFKEKYKQAEEEMKINKLLEERQLSSNERELLAYNKKMREDDIKKEVDKIHKQQTKESWKPKKTILHSDYNILKSEKPKVKHIFMNKSNFIKSKRGLK